MKHTLLYMGRLSLNLDRLTPETMDYVKQDGSKGLCDQPSSSVNGIVFAYMESGSRHFAVRVGRVQLDVPVEIYPQRHSDGKGFGPSASLFGDASAQALVADAIRYNPALAEDIVHEVWQSIVDA